MMEQERKTQGMGTTQMCPMGMDQERKIQGMGTMPMCPMASKFARMAEKPGFGLLLAMPGLVLVLVGVSIFVEPRVLVWLIASASMLVGLVMLFFAMSIRKTTARFTHVGE